VARLATGVSIAQARSEVEQLGRQIHEAHISRFAAADAGPWGATLRPLDAIRFDPVMGRSAMALTAAVALVLLLACANLAGLLLARATSRTREIAVRFALGATRGQVLRQMLTDGAVLAVLGGAAGLTAAAIGIETLRRQWTAGATAMGRVEGLTLLGMDAIRLDGTVLLFSAAVTLATAALVGLMPALRSSRADLTRDLKTGSASAEETTRWLRLGLRDGLVAGEIALAMVLLAGAGLLLRSLDRLLSVDVGIASDQVVTLRYALPAADRSRDSTAAFHGAVIDRIGAVPGVSAAAIGNCPPLAGGCNGSIIWFRDRPEVPEGTEPGIGVHFVSPDYASALGIRVLQGRWFSRDDRLESPKVVVINETAARKYWPDENPIGKPIGIGMGGFADRAEVVGVVSDVRFGTVEEEPVPDAFISYLQSPRSTGMLFVRSAAPPAALLPVVRAALRDVDRQIAVYDERPMAERVRLATIRQRFTGGVLSTFAIAALGLAAIGLYGLISWEVGRRTREIGIRMALGAHSRAILGLVAGRAALLAGIGLGIGLALSLGLNRLLQSLLFGIESTDPATYAAVSALLLAVVAAATLVPARRAVRVDPAAATRE
jgi:predicted permease